MSPEGPEQKSISLPVYTALAIPTVAAYPSINCLQWSADGQLCFVSRNAVHILTPDPGINFDNTSVVKSTPSKNDPALGWFKTMIQHDTAEPIGWPDYSQAWGAVSLGSVDPSLCGIAISPSGLSPNGGCVVATLSSNMDLNLWTASKHYLKGEWPKVFELTPYLLDLLAPADEDKQSIPVVLQAQVVCMEWTTQADFGILPSPWINGSLLILGTRAGTLTFLRYRNGELPEHVTSLAVADMWITHLAFSTWNLVQPGHCEGHLAYGTSDGSVGLLKISQILLEENNFSFVPKYNVKLDLDHHPSQMVYGPQNLAGITAMRWIKATGRNPILVTSNPGLINLWSPSSDNIPTIDSWIGYRSLRIRRQNISVDSSAFHHVTGVLYLQNQDALVITLFDGSFHVICDLFRDPRWASTSAGESDYGPLTSENLSKVSRSMFVKAEKGNVDRRDMVRINGVASTDDASCFSWIYESSRPSDFSYKHDAKHSNMLIVAQMWEEHDGGLFLDKLSTLLNTVKASSGFGPLHMLRPFLLRLREPAELDLLRERFLEVLKPRLQEDHSLKVQLASWEGDITPDVRVKFRVGLSTNLFGWDDLLSLRMRLSLADVCWKLTSNEKQQMACGLIAQDLLNTISHRVLRTIVRHLVSVVKTLTFNEMPFVSRMVVQSLLPGSPPDLTEEGKNLSALVQHLVGIGPPTKDLFNIASQLNEICPACGVQVPLKDITMAVCDNGHKWARCSVTTFILSTPWVRTCVGCSRKAFLPPSAHKELPMIAQAWVVEELLEAVHRCLFCNNGFVCIL